MQRMKLFTLIIMLSLILMSANGIAQTQSDPNWIFDTIKAPSLEGNLLEDDPNRLLEIYLPPSYHESEKRYPVVYYLWGYNGSGKKPTFTVRKHKELIDEKISQNLLGEMIVVFISGSNKLRGSFYINSPVSGKWADFVTKDVVEYIDNTYRTLANRDSRSITGSSMGGYGAMTISMLYPDIYCAGYGISPGAYTKEGFNNSQIVYRENNIENTIEMIERFQAMPGKKAHKAFLDFMETNTDKTLFFTMAYGVAHAPDTKKPPYFKFPFKKDGDAIVVDKDVWYLWQNGFGGLDVKIKVYKSNLEKLKIYGLSVGYNEGHPWIYEGCKYYTNQLLENNINHVFHLHHGTHTSRTVEVLVNQVLPLLANVMAQ